MYPANHIKIIDFVDVCTVYEGVLSAPTLYSVNANNKYLVWEIYVAMQDSDTAVTEDIIVNRELPDAPAIYWTVSGQEGMKMTTSATTIVTAGKNIGKNNYTTPLTQAISAAMGEYNKKIRRGYTINKDSVKRVGQVVSLVELITDKNRGEYPWRVFGMAIHNYKKFSHKINWPATIQPKLDGTLLIVIAHPDLPLLNGMHIDRYSRGRKTYAGQDHILDELYPVLKKFKSLHLVGELWREGFSLQDISGASRRKVDSDNKLLFNVFDCFCLERPKMIFSNRQELLRRVFITPLKYSTPIYAIPVKNDAEVQVLYKKYLDQNLEGAVIRNNDSLYEFGLNRERRSYTALKLKPRDDAEWPVVSYEDGEGKETGAIKWICCETDEFVKARTGKLLPIEERTTFCVTPNQKTELRKAIYAAMPKLFESHIHGALVVISYSDLNKSTGIPQQPKMLRFRDEEINILLANLLL
jgi:hypothetical protein